jgi:hypothetical protein
MRILIDTSVFREIGKIEPDTNVATWLDTVEGADLAGGRSRAGPPNVVVVGARGSAFGASSCRRVRGRGRTCPVTKSTATT